MFNEPHKLEKKSILPCYLRPKAGEVCKTEAEEILYLAPLPVCTGQSPANIHDFYEVNDVYLQINSSNKDIVASGKIFARTIRGIMFFLVALPIAVATFSYALSVEDTSFNFSHELRFNFQLFWTYGLVGPFLFIGVHVWGLIAGTRKRAGESPLRFNRQRREVCLVSNDTGEVLIVPWEAVIASVSNIKIASNYGDMVFNVLRMALEDKDKGVVQPIQFVKLTQTHAISTWEAIRQYMEYGLPKDDALQLLLLGRAPTEYELRPYEGLHTWEVEKRRKKEEGNLYCGFSPKRRAEIGLPKPTRWPLRRWYIWRVLSFWKMPYMIAEWSHKAGTPYIPEKVREWSAPIPEEQWAKPSAELLKATQIVEQAMNRKKNKLNFIAACELIGKAGI